MRVILNVSELLFDIRNKSHEECAEIADAETRYRAEAGTHKNEELFRCLAEVGTALARTCIKYLDNYYQEEADDTLALPEALVYDLDFSERRAEGKAQPLADAMHSYAVHYTLAKYYATVSQGELSNKHSLLTNNAATAIKELLYTKKAPIV